MFGLNPQLAKTSDRRRAVFAGREILDPRSAFGDRRKHYRPVRYGFVAGNSDRAGQRAGGCDLHALNLSEAGRDLS